MSSNSLGTMARGKSMLDEIRKELECPVCQEQFSENNEPKILKCQHTFCKSCLNGWLRRHGGGRLSCPNCRVITECPNDNIDCLPTNLGFKNLGVILEAHGDLSNGDRRDIRSQEENICERHRKKLEHYCEQCQICICSDCVIVEHRDPKSHQIVSIEHGAKIQGVIITEKLRSLEAITSRFRRDIATLLERRDKFNTNIEQAVKELHKAAESCRNLIRQHEASVTEQLVRERSLYDNTISQELSKLTGKLEIMASVAIRGKTILENRNIEEMITMKQILDELTSDKVRPLLRYPDVKYTPSAHPRNLPTGKLFITHTEPSMSVVTGEGLTSGIQSQEANFTVTTKDSTGQTTYSEIDKVIVEITSVRKGIKDIPVVIKELKDGRYSVFYTPNSFGEFRVSIKVRDEPIRGSPFKLRIQKIPKPIVFEGSSKFQGVKLHRDWIPQPGNRQGVLLPAYWIPQPKDSQGVEMTVHLVELDPKKDSQQYKRVQDRFQQTCSGNQIVKIERVQNPALFGSYMIRKQKMDETKGSNEQWLFHGTPGNNCKLINHTGFNRSFHGKNATVYGNGVYFAEDASYSARSTYSPPDASGLRYMYYSRVLVGEYTKGNQGLLTPPAKNPNDPTDTYDSVVDQIPNPKIFVLFYDWQCYPEYLITFR